MANPFLVLGGIAVGVITATFGILQVPGWVASAQDAAAKNDLANIRIAEAAIASATGSYTGSLIVLADGGNGTMFALSGGVELTGLSGGQDAWCGTVKSASGRHFAASSNTASFGEGASPEEAATDAGCAATPELGPSITFTLNCPDPASVKLPLVEANGIAKWSTGTEEVVSGATSAEPLAANTDYTVTFEGTFKRISTQEAGVWPMQAACFRSVDSWTGQTETNSLADAFNNMVNLTSVPAELPDGITITNMYGAFNGAEKFNSSLAGWDTSEVDDMSYMFYRAEAFNQPIGAWDVTKVSDFSSMFDGATTFNQPLPWTTTAAERMGNMFFNAMSFNQDLTGWNVTGVTDHSQFAFGSALTQGHLPAGWLLAD